MRPARGTAGMKLHESQRGDGAT